MREILFLSRYYATRISSAAQFILSPIISIFYLYAPRSSPVRKKKKEDERTQGVFLFHCRYLGERGSTLGLRSSGASYVTPPSYYPQRLKFDYTAVAVVRTPRSSGDAGTFPRSRRSSRGMHRQSPSDNAIPMTPRLSNIRRYRVPTTREYARLAREAREARHARIARFVTRSRVLWLR